MSYEKTSKKPLFEQLESFRKWRNWIAIPLIAIGVISLLLPILPGILIIFLGIMLINPELADRIREKFINLKKKFVS